MRFMVFTLLATVFALSLIVGYQFSAIAQSRHASRVAALNTWHIVICGIESSVLSSKTSTPAQKRAVTKYWDGVLVNIGARACPVPSSK